MTGNEQRGYRKFVIPEERNGHYKERVIHAPAVGFCLRMDIKHFFPNWDRMSESDRALWREKWRIYCMCHRGNI